MIFSSKGWAMCQERQTIEVYWVHFIS